MPLRTFSRQDFAVSKEKSPSFQRKRQLQAEVGEDVNDNDGKTKELQLNLTGKVTWDELSLSRFLGEEYSHKKLPDGRLAFYSDLGEIFLTISESEFVESDQEITDHVMDADLKARQVIQTLTLGELIPGGDGYSSIDAMSKAMQSDMRGTTLLVALLIANKMSVADVWRKSNLGSLAFLEALSACDFKEWNQ